MNRQNICGVMIVTLIDFTDCVVNPYKAYGGANGAKLGIIYNGKQYMLKFQQHPKRSKTMKYTNSIISEHLGSAIFNFLGIPAQKTLLGVYKDKPVVACMDFEEDGFRLFDFASIKNTVIDSVHEGYGTDLDSILQAIEEQVIVSPIELKSFFGRCLL